MDSHVKSCAALGIQIVLDPHAKISADACKCANESSSSFEIDRCLFTNRSTANYFPVRAPEEVIDVLRRALPAQILFLKPVYLNILTQVD